MSTQISNSFVRQYEAEVKEAYQRLGSKFRNTIVTRNGVVGTSTTFQKIGKGAASQKGAINGTITPMSVDHTAIVCTLQDWYASDLVDKLDEKKIAHDERRVIVNAGAYALGRKTDELIIDALDGTSNVVTAGSGITLPKVFEAYETLGGNDALEGGRLYFMVGPKQWSSLMQIEQFASADYVGVNELPFTKPGVSAKFFLNTTVMMHSGLTLDTADRECLWYNETSAAHAIGTDIEVDIDWDGERQAHRITNRMSMGACLVDDDGVVLVDVAE